MPMRPLAQVWYPALGKPAAAPFFRRPGRFADGAIVGAPPAVTPEACPLLFYFPGWQGMEIENHGLIGHLARHGYIVVGITYPRRTAQMMDVDHRRLIGHLRWPMMHSSEEVHRRTMRIAEGRVQQRSRDAVGVLDQLTRRQAADDMLARRIDLARIGILGFSLGGAVAADTAIRDPRFRAAINIDGRHWGRALEQGVRQPYLFIGAERRMPEHGQLTAADAEIRYNAILDQRDFSQLSINLRRHGGVQVSVMGAEHMSFTDQPRRQQLLQLLRRGRMSSRQAVHIVRAYALAFFDQTLRGGASELLMPGARPIRRTRIQIWPPRFAEGGRPS